MKEIKVGLLPLYIELYDKTSADRRPMIESFYELIAGELEKKGLSVARSPVCRLKKEFGAAVRSFESANVDAIVTLHLAYSPSLESSDVLASTALPIIVLDTTPTFEFGPEQQPKQIMYNHGIHGVQDMCNMLLRNGKTFRIEAGHWKRSDVLDRVVSLARAAALSSSMRNARVGRIGAAFKGMGDFSVPPALLRKTVGTLALPCDPKRMRQIVKTIRAKEIDAEAAGWKKRFSSGKFDAAAFQTSALTALAVRRWIEEEELTAFTMSFLSAGRGFGLPTVPFMEASLAMERGIGYAGEGDVLTAALVGALLSIYSETTFTEMFCPDWKGNRVFLSHMGEINPALIKGKPGLVMPQFPYAKTKAPLKPVGRLKGGRAVFVNLAPQRGLEQGESSSAPRYSLILTPVEMDGSGDDRFMKETVRGWFKPRMALADFLAAYSEAGGTHHAALVYGACERELDAFGCFMGWNRVLLK